MKNLIYPILSLFVSCATFAQTDTTRCEYPFDEYLAEFPGGKNELIKFLSENIQYPEVAKKIK